MLKCGHLCLKSCEHVDECGECKVVVKKQILHCNHDIYVSCDTTSDGHACKEECNRNYANCDHFCKKTCGSCMESCQECTEETFIKLDCAHRTNISIPCHVKCKTDERLLAWMCQVECKE